MTKGIRTAVIVAVVLEWLTIAITIVIYLTTPATISLDVQTALIGLMTVVLTQVLVLLLTRRPSGPNTTTLAQQFVTAMQLGAQIAREDILRGRDGDAGADPESPTDELGGPGLRAV